MHESVQYMYDKEHTTYNERLYLDEFMQRGFMGVLELFADVEEVNLRAGHHDTDESPVVCSQPLQGKSQRLESSGLAADAYEAEHQQ